MPVPPKKKLPLVVIATGLATGIGACSPEPSNEDAGTSVCGSGCFAARETDGGYRMYEDGGVVCYC